jgi:large subunit ribosomal protein L11
MVEKTLSFIVPGGQATGGPPIGPALGPLGVNIMEIVSKINEETSEYNGTPIPVHVILDTDTKQFTVKVGMLSTFALITQVIGVSKGSSQPNLDYVADLSFDDLMNIAQKKQDGLLAASLKSAVKEVLGTCQSMGVTVEGKAAKIVQNEIRTGEHDFRFN